MCGSDAKKHIVFSPFVTVAPPAAVSPSSTMGMEAVGAWVARITILLLSLRAAYQIRTYAIRDYGLVIHEFDPWFNFRATQYLARPYPPPARRRKGAREREGGETAPDVATTRVLHGSYGS